MTDLTKRISEIIKLTDGMDHELKPFIELYGEHYKNSPESKGQNFWSYDGPQSNIDYRINWEYSTDSGLHFEGVDIDGDHHSWTLPTEFIEQYEAKVAELVVLKAEREREQRAAVEREQARRQRDAKLRRRAQYETLRKEFEHVE